jgi:hypothetical protein
MPFVKKSHMWGRHARGFSPPARARRNDGPQGSNPVRNATSFFHLHRSIHLPAQTKPMAALPKSIDAGGLYCSVERGRPRCVSPTQLTLRWVTAHLMLASSFFVPSRVQSGEAVAWRRLGAGQMVRVRVSNCWERYR